MGTGASTHPVPPPAAWATGTARVTGLIAHLELARELGIGARVVRLWIDTGLWPLPRAATSAGLYFRSSDIRAWVRTGEWPPDVVFRQSPRGTGAEGPP